MFDALCEPQKWGRVAKSKAAKRQFVAAFTGCMA